jgi:hypothetical protein
MKRTDFEVCKSIFEVLFQKNPIHKSNLRELTGLGARSVNKWVDLITFIQSQSKLKITKSGRYEMLELQKQDVDMTVYPETLEALKVMRALLETPPEELKRRVEALKE